MKITPARITKLADKAGISIGAHDGSPYPTIEQLQAFAAEVTALCAAKCQAIAEKHAQAEGSRASGMKAGALDCQKALAT